MRSACLLVITIVLAFFNHQLAADPIQIVSINTSGDLVWVNTNQAAGIYRVEYKDYLDDLWETFPGLEQIVSDTSTTEIPMDLSDVEEQRFFRVLWLNSPVADSFVDFRGTQGNNGWQYGYALPASNAPADPDWFRELPDFNEGVWTVNEDLYWTLISRQTMHPNGALTSGGKQPVNQWAVLRWTSTLDGPVQIDVFVGDLNNTGGNGVILRMFQNGVERDVRTLENGGQADYSVNLTLTEGQTIDLALDPNASDDLADATQYKVVIHRD